MTYDQWVTFSHTLGAVATTWPFDDKYNGQPASRFPAALYVSAFNNGQLPTGDGTQTTNTPTGQYVYVLAQAIGGPDVLAGAPHTMTNFERFENAAFTLGDEAADAAGLPSLNHIHDVLTGLAGQIVAGVAVTYFVTQLLKSRRK